MILLSFDTALDKTYISLSKDGEILDTKIIKNTEDNYHSAFLISGIKNILRKNSFKPQDINLLGVNIGPGSFTGIRAGLTVAKVMAQELNIKVVAVPSLKILSKLNDGNKPTLVALDARRDMAYIFYHEILKIVSIEELKKLIANSDYFIICDKSLSNILDLKDALVYENTDYDLGEILNKISYEEQDSAISPMELKAKYIQPPPVFVKK